MIARIVLTVALAFSVAASESQPPVIRKVFLPSRLHLGNTGIAALQPIDSAAWIWHPDFGDPPASAHRAFFAGGWKEPVLLRFRKSFDAATAPLRIHVSADERFELFLDGNRVARGPDRSDVEHWCYATYEINLPPGSHRLEAVAWSVGPYAPVAQLSWRGGFILKAEGDYDRQLTTGTADWEVARLDGCAFAPGVVFVGASLTARGSGPAWQEGKYVKAVVVRGPVHSNDVGETVPGWKLFPTRLPDQVDRETNAGRAVALGSGALGGKDVVTAEEARNPDLAKWQRLLSSGEEVIVPPHAEKFLLWDLGNYYTAYPLCEVSGGAGSALAWSWAESLYLPGSEGKGQRDEFIGKNFRGMTDTFLPSGGARKKFSTLWWRAGRWCLLSIKTGAEPLTLHRVV